MDEQEKTPPPTPSRRPSQMKGQGMIGVDATEREEWKSKPYMVRRAAAENDRLKRRAEVAELVTSGHSYRQISAIMGIHISTISRDIKACREEWAKIAIENIDDLKGREVKKLQRIYREAFAAWEASKKPLKKVVRKVDEDGRESTSTTIQERVGDSKMLGICKDCIAKTAEILGLTIRRIETSGESSVEVRSQVMHEIMLAAERKPRIIDDAELDRIMEAELAKPIDSAGAIEGPQ